VEVWKHKKHLDDIFSPKLMENAIAKVLGVEIQKLFVKQPVDQS